MIFQENVISPYPKNKKRDGLRCSVQEEKTLCLSGHQLDCEKSYTNANASVSVATDVSTASLYLTVAMLAKHSTAVLY
ncbi:MAG: hypothetical protein ACJZ9F_12640 [Rhodospirillaceae bacterium]